MAVKFEHDDNTPPEEINVMLDDDVVELQTLDAIRVAPEVTRAFEAGPSGLDLIVFGPRCDGDGEVLMGWWAD